MSSSDASTRPAKRLRTEPADYTSYVKDSDYYFTDGAICIATKNTDTLFRVHQGMLVRHSQVFRDMFSIPRPEADGASQDESVYEGAPVVQLDDRTEDIRALFRLMYDSP